MNLVKFMMNSVNVFPLANDTRNGQLLTEFNLRSRESVMTPEKVKYHIGPSYTHSETDFYVSKQTDDIGIETGSDIIQISAGRAIINGHYFESLVPVTFTMAEVNALLGKYNQKAIKGRVAVGLRAMYSTLPTLAGAMMTSTTDNFFEGIQIVVLPVDDVVLPVNSPNDAGKVNCHLLLAKFNYINQAITGDIQNNYPDKCRCIPASRISDFEDVLSSTYITKKGMNPKQLYVFSMKGNTSEQDTMCLATDSLMVWDRIPKLTTTKPLEKEAAFAYDSAGRTLLVMPHKQVDGIEDSNGKAQYYETKSIPLPLADYVKGTPGTVDGKYADYIKSVERKIREIYLMPAGRQRGFLETLNSLDDLPPIGPKWIPGDYIVIGQDMTLDSQYDSTRPPSTMYVVLPGQVLSIKPYTQFPATIPPTGVRLQAVYWSEESGQGVPDKTTAETYTSYFDITGQIYRGLIDQDYFEVSYTKTDGKIEHYYYTVATTDKPAWSSAVWLTAEIPLATRSAIGGFFNVDNTALGNGYVYLDDSGHLRMLDYDLLATGVLAYRLGEDVEIESGLSVDEIQTELNQRVNQRVAFPSIEQANEILTNTDFAEERNGGSNANVVNVTINFSASDTTGAVTIEDIDSRFNTAVHLILQGEINSNTVINITDCQKIRIINKLTYEGDVDNSRFPTINVARCGLYYDPVIFNEINIVEGLSIWYERYEDTDPKLQIDGMTVRELDTPIAVEELEFWEESKAANDNHYLYALHSVTFGDDGNIIGCEMIVRNETTANIDSVSQAIVAKFTLPSGVGLKYPLSKLTKRLKITGSFVTAYEIDDPKGWKIIDTNFTALTNVYDPYSTPSSIDGVISFYARIEDLTNVIIPEDMHSIDGWDSNSFHIFSGGVLT